MKTSLGHLPQNKQDELARYNAGYKITEEELKYLAERVQVLMGLTKKIESFT